MSATTATPTGQPALSRTAKRLLEAVAADDVAPGAGWGYYLPDADVGTGMRARDRLLKVGYICDARPGERNGVYALTGAGRRRLTDLRHQDRAYAQPQREARARAAARALIAAYEADRLPMPGLSLPSADKVAAMDDDGWRDLARAAGLDPEVYVSAGEPAKIAERRAAVVAEYRGALEAREREEAAPDAFVDLVRDRMAAMSGLTQRYEL